MNLRLFSIALMTSALPLIAHADPTISLDKADFVVAKTISQDGETIVSAKLSKSGKAKFKKLNKQVNSEVHTDIAGVESDFKLREPIVGDGLQMGPYSNSDAQKVVTAINVK
jgi:hypothetical protein